MNKSELIEKVAKDTGIPENTARAAVDSLIEGIRLGVRRRNQKVTLVGFGTFKNIYRKARMGQNPRTGKRIKIKGRNVVIFKPGKRLREVPS